MLPWKLAPSFSLLGLIAEGLEDGDAHDELPVDSLLDNENVCIWMVENKLRKGRLVRFYSLDHCILQLNLPVSAAYPSLLYFSPLNVGRLL
jgi:hypothetical protein